MRSSNPQPSPWKGDALPIELISHLNSYLKFLHSIPNIVLCWLFQGNPKNFRSYYNKYPNPDSNRDSHYWPVDFPATLYFYSQLRFITVVVWTMS